LPATLCFVRWMLYTVCTIILICYIVHIIYQMRPRIIRRRERAVKCLEKKGIVNLLLRIDLLITLAHPSIVWVHVQHAIIIAWNHLESVSLSSNARTVDDMAAMLWLHRVGRATTRCISVITITPSCLSTVRNNTHEYLARWTTDNTINANIIVLGWKSVHCQSVGIIIEIVYYYNKIMSNY